MKYLTCILLTALFAYQAGAQPTVEEEALSRMKNGTIMEMKSESLYVYLTEWGGDSGLVLTCLKADFIRAVSRNKESKYKWYLVGKLGEYDLGVFETYLRAALIGYPRDSSYSAYIKYMRKRFSSR